MRAIVLKLRLLLLCMAIVLAGCAAAAMKTWLGHPEAEMLASWGAPDRSAQSGGKTFHTWNGRNGYGQIVCTSTFVIDEAGIIESYSTNCP